MPGGNDIDPKLKKQRDKIEKDVEALSKNMKALSKNIEVSTKKAINLGKEG
jgi:hypothetical protein